MHTVNRNEMASLVENTALFAGLKPEEIKGALGCIGAFVKTVDKGGYIELGDKDVRNIGLVLKGKVQMVRDDMWGNKTVMATMNAGEIFGESFACGTQMAATVSFTAIAASQIMFMPFARVMHTCSQSCHFHQKLTENMVGVLAEKNVMLMEKIDIMSKKTVREKIEAYLADQAQKASSRYFEIPLGRVQLGEYLCVDRSALTRELNNMRDDGLIDFDRNTFHILKDFN